MREHSGDVGLDRVDSKGTAPGFRVRRSSGALPQDPEQQSIAPGMIASVAASIPANHLCRSLFRPSYSGCGDNRWKWPTTGQLPCLLRSNTGFLCKVLVRRSCRQLRSRVQTVCRHCLKTSRRCPSLCQASQDAVPQRRQDFIAIYDSLVSDSENEGYFMK